MKRRQGRKTQSILEYTLILSAVILGIIAMSGKMKKMVEDNFNKTVEADNAATDTFKGRMQVDAPPLR
jgi:Flp pilus assembly pilin Flp